MLVGDWNKLFEIKSSTDFISAPQAEKDNLPSYEGTYKGLAVFNMHNLEIHGKILIADLKRLGLLLEAPYAEGDIKMNVRSINEKDIDDWISKEAKILEKEDGSRMTKEEALDYFSDRVHLEILEKMEYRGSKDTKGVKYSRYFEVA